jgi:hypothetical protein
VGIGTDSRKEFFIPTSIEVFFGRISETRSNVVASCSTISPPDSQKYREKTAKPSLSRVLDSPFVRTLTQFDCICVDYFVFLDNI